jgi:hypothetical protein
MQWAFRDPDVDWLWCMHDDVWIAPGWPSIIASYPADVYAAPFGDMCFLLSRQAFQAVGWFDERFPGIGYQDNDWQLRAAWKLGTTRVVLENKFTIGAALNWVMVNPIGLDRYWVATESFHHNRAGTAAGLEWFRAKWEGRWLETLSLPEQIPPPVISEIDWYPWFLR